MKSQPAFEITSSPPSCSPVCDGLGTKWPMAKRVGALTYLVLLWLAAAGAFAEVRTVTAYCACKICCGPKAKGLTASGKRPVQGLTVAGPRALPFGTRVWIEGVGERIVQDRLALRYDGRFDVYFDSHIDAKRFGVRKLNVSVLAPTP